MCALLVERSASPATHPTKSSIPSSPFSEFRLELFRRYRSMASLITADLLRLPSRATCSSLLAVNSSIFSDITCMVENGYSTFNLQVQRSVNGSLGDLLRLAPAQPDVPPQLSRPPSASRPPSGAPSCSISPPGLGGCSFSP